MACPTSQCHLDRSSSSSKKKKKFPAPTASAHNKFLLFETRHYWRPLVPAGSFPSVRERNGTLLSFEVVGRKWKTSSAPQFCSEILLQRHRRLFLHIKSIWRRRSIAWLNVDWQSRELLLLAPSYGISHAVCVIVEEEGNVGMFLPSMEWRHTKLVTLTLLTLRWVCAWLIPLCWRRRRRLFDDYRNSGSAVSQTFV